MILKDIIKEKNNYLDNLIKEFEREFEGFSVAVKQRLAALIRKGNFEREVIDAVFEDTGYNKLAYDFTQKYEDAIKYSNRLSKQLGYSVVLPDRSYTLLELVEANSFTKILNARTSIVDAIAEAGLRREIEGTPFRVIVAELENKISELGRRIATEVHTGSYMFDRTIKNEQFKAAGIEKFVYFGPYDDKTRESCAAVLGDSRQETGWTRAEIAGSGVSFVGGGGYNCRHEWLPYVPGSKELIDEMVQDAEAIQIKEQVLQG